ncbi:MAG: hypothetical protein GVY19_04145 [Bacteroidetes bacterium]|jgi:hypothetical protein|nr:hypothetical protein [Bacteroidota bacterium]
MYGTSYFIEPDKNINEDVDRVALKFYAEMSPETIINRWNEPENDLIYAYLRTNDFSKEAIKQKIGMLYGKYDLRGIDLSNLV